MRKFMAILICLATLCAAINPAFAATIDNDVIYEERIIGDTFVDPELVGTTYHSDGIMPMDFYNEIPIVSKTFTTRKTVYVTPTGQPSLGYEGGEGNFVFFFETGGSSYKFTVSIDTKYVTFTAETGKTSSTGSGYGKMLPKAPGRYRFEFIKNYVITTKKVDVYQYSLYKYSYYIHDPQYSLGSRWVVVP